MTRTWIFTLLLTCLFVSTGAAATFNFSASDEYIIKGETVEFKMVYDPEDGPAADSLLIELDYDDDRENEYSKEFTDVDAKITTEPELKIDKPGYFEAEAVFTLTFTDEDGREREKPWDLLRSMRQTGNSMTGEGWGE